MRRAPRLTAISSGRSLPGDDYSAWLGQLRDAGVEAVQIREKDIEDRVLLVLVREAVRVMAAGGARVLVNGRADVALAAGAGGVHLPTSGLPVSAVRRLIGDAPWIGCSTHSLAEIERARDQGADYAYFSPIYDTPGKSPPTGLHALARAAELGVPLIALGGITIDRFPELVAAGAAGVAGIGMFSPPDDLERLVAAAERHFQHS
jgi:thiamine-phosphate pyrophosphorylase